MSFNRKMRIKNCLLERDVLIKIGTVTNRYFNTKRIYLVQLFMIINRMTVLNS